MNHPLPRPEELFANGKAFTKIDLSQAYKQMQLEESSAQYLTINTPMGLYQYTRRVKREKCVFFQNSVEYLRHLVDAAGLHTLPSKVEAILQAPDPKMCNN